MSLTPGQGKANPKSTPYGTFDLRQFAGADELAHAASRDLLEVISQFSSAKDIFSTALSGGRIARGLLSAVATQAKALGVSFRNVHFFWSDERCVPPDDPESNFRPAQELLFRPLNIPTSQIHRVQGEKSPETAAAMAEAELRGLI